MKAPECSNGEDQIFWDRLAEMPWHEAEQECVLRREGLALQLNMLESRLLEIGKLSKEAKEVGKAKLDVQTQLLMVNERTKYLRRVIDRVKWRAAVEAIYGPEGCEQVAAWIAQQEGIIQQEEK